MDDRIRAGLAAAGIDVDEALERFMGSEAMLTRFLEKFPADPGFSALAAALAAGDQEGAVNAAHTLKGLCGNLSIRPLFTGFDRQVALMRAGDWAAAAAMMPQLTEDYNRAVEAISALG
ncbi:Hpt domain-containing protein [uncultured Pseudoflavonifractor sp.]|uniref:Hpt domain-containing protein n=1 Tax=uncultured Pseudoflavonifractor sp. TaxID=1221379 RepID=UPI0025CEC5A5|nr:Hpt domain-containing protein [uncultured Pseudoflavonifractor sp.]